MNNHNISSIKIINTQRGCFLGLCQQIESFGQNLCDIDKCRLDLEPVLGSFNKIKADE